MTTRSMKITGAGSGVRDRSMGMKEAGLVVACLLMAACTPPADKLTVAIGGTGQSLQGRAAREFADRLQVRLGDEYRVAYYDSGQLGDDRQLIQKLRLGTVHLATISSVMASVSEDFALFDLPFLVRDREHLKQIDEVLVRTRLADSARQQGLEVISTWENGYRQITNSRRPIVVPEDLRGLKIRTPPSEWRTMMFSAWGANPTPMAFSELFVALQTGVVDGQENPLTNVDGGKLYEVQKYLSITDHVYSPIWLVAGARVWSRFPDRLREAVAAVAEEVQAWSLEEGLALDRKLLADFEARSMAVNQADRRAFVEASQPIYRAFAERVPGGQEMIDQVHSLIEGAGNPPP